MTSQPDLHPAPAAPLAPERQGSVWTSIAIASALTVWVGGILPPTLGILAALAAILGLVGATIAVIRDERTAWRIAAGFAGLASLAGIGVYALVALTFTA